MIVANAWPGMVVDLYRSRNGSYNHVYLHRLHPRQEHTLGLVVSVSHVDWGVLVTLLLVTVDMSLVTLLCDGNGELRALEDT